MKKLLLLTLLLSSSGALFAQGEDVHNHVHGRNEIGLSVGPSYSFDHKEWKASAHVHYFRLLKPHSRWALGAGVESVFGEGSHYNFSAGVKYSPINHVQIALMPGVNLVKEKGEHGHSGEDAFHDKFSVRFAMHAEMVADLLIIGNFHMGPTMDFSWSKHHSHLMLGVHTAYSF
ncbi:MAG: hypothetical protein ACRC9Q_05750 [Bacteroidales bacterium]